MCIDKDRAVQVSVKQDPFTLNDIKQFRVSVNSADDARLEALSKLYAAAAVTQSIIFVSTDHRV